MTDRCRYAGPSQPRVIPGRHDGDCRGIVAYRGAADYDECSGCQPCERAHCRVCGIAHAAGTCAECVAASTSARSSSGDA